MIAIHRQQVNRIVVILRPKLPFLNWISGVEPGLRLTLAELRREQDALLLTIPEIESTLGAKAWAFRNWDMLFDKSLFDWYTDEQYWPKSRDLALFQEWFDVEWHPIVWDLSQSNLTKSSGYM